MVRVVIPTFDPEPEGRGKTPVALCAKNV